MKLGPKVFAASVLAASPFWLAGPASAVPIGMGLELKAAASSEPVRVAGVAGVAAVGHSGSVLPARPAPSARASAPLALPAKPSAPPQRRQMSCPSAGKCVK
jgi:hypothetical protein